MSIWWSLHLRREAASVPLARRLLTGAMETAGVDPDVSYELSVALSEACANAVEHGGGEAPGQARGEYRVTAYLDGERCRIEVADSGPGFPGARGEKAGRAVRRRARLPHPTSPAQDGAHAEHGRGLAEHGRGLFLIEALADHVDVRNKPGRGAVVSFDKILKWREGALLPAVP